MVTLVRAVTEDEQVRLAELALSDAQPQRGKHDGELRLHDTETGETFPDWNESEAKRKSEAAKRKVAERRIAELEARLRPA